MLRETAKKRATSQTVHASVSMLNVMMLCHDSTIRKRTNNYGLFGKVAGESLFSLKSVTTVWLFVVWWKFEDPDADILK